MTWDAKGTAHCDSCRAFKEVDGDTNRLRALGWHHSKGTTVGGADYEGILCPLCARNERKRERSESGQYDGQLDIFDGIYSSPIPAVRVRRGGRKFTGD